MVDGLCDTGVLITIRSFGASMSSCGISTRALDTDIVLISAAIAGNGAPERRIDLSRAGPRLSDRGFEDRFMRDLFAGSSPAIPMRGGRQTRYLDQPFYDAIYIRSHTTFVLSIVSERSAVRRYL